MFIFIYSPQHEILITVLVKMYNFFSEKLNKIILNFNKKIYKKIMCLFFPSRRLIYQMITHFTYFFN